MYYPTYNPPNFITSCPKCHKIVLFSKPDLKKYKYCICPTCSNLLSYGYSFFFFFLNFLFYFILLSFILYSFIFYLLSFIFYLLSFIFYLFSFIFSFSFFFFIFLFLFPFLFFFPSSLSLSLPLKTKPPERAPIFWPYRIECKSCFSQIFLERNFVWWANLFSYFLLFGLVISFFVCTLVFDARLVLVIIAVMNFYLFFIFLFLYLFISLFLYYLLLFIIILILYYYIYYYYFCILSLYFLLFGLVISFFVCTLVFDAQLVLVIIAVMNFCFFFIYLFIYLFIYFFIYIFIFKFLFFFFNILFSFSLSLSLSLSLSPLMTQIFFLFNLKVVMMLLMTCGFSTLFTSETGEIISFKDDVLLESLDILNDKVMGHGKEEERASLLSSSLTKGAKYDQEDLV